MITAITFFLYLMASIAMHGQSLCDNRTSFKVLHFTETQGFNHNTATASNAMFIAIGMEHGFDVTDSDDVSIFDDLSELQTFAIVIFSNTSGSFLNATQKANFESYIDGGGSFIGIHAASDTYRTGWPFYNSVVGAIVQSGPNHTSANHNNFMDHQVTHPILTGLPDPWQKTEEYYYWDLNGGMIDTINFTTVLKVRSTGGASYDRSRPMAIFREFDNGSRSFYTALGHSASNFSSDDDFKQLLSNAVCWAAYDPTNTQDISISAERIETKVLRVTNASNSMILTAPNGSCYSISVDNNGNLTTTPVDCN